MPQAVVFDREQLTEETSPSRSRCGPDDPDPLLVQIGAVRLALSPPFALADSFQCIVRPVGRDGPVRPGAFFARLTGIDGDRIAREGRPLAEAPESFARFAGPAPLFSRGKDEITALAPACFVSGLRPPLPASRFGNAAAFLLRSGEPLDTVHRLRSHSLPAHFGLPPEPRAHDGLADARAVARVLSHLLRLGRLGAGDFDRPAAAP